MRNGRDAHVWNIERLVVPGCIRGRNCRRVWLAHVALKPPRLFDLGASLLCFSGLTPASFGWISLSNLREVQTFEFYCIAACR